MKKDKKIIALSLAAVLALGVSGCQTKKDSDEKTDTVTNVTDSADETTDAKDLTTLTTSKTMSSKVLPAGTVKITDVKDDQGATLEEKFTNFILTLQNYTTNNYQNGKVAELADRDKDAALAKSKVFSNITHFTTGTVKNEFSSIGVVADTKGGNVCKVVIEFINPKESADFKLITSKCGPGSAKDIAKDAKKNMEDEMALANLPATNTIGSAALTNPSPAPTKK